MLIFYEQPQSLTPHKDPHLFSGITYGADPSKRFQAGPVLAPYISPAASSGAFFLFLRICPARTDYVTRGKKSHILTVTLLSRESRTVPGSGIPWAVRLSVWIGNEAVWTGWGGEEEESAGGESDFRMPLPQG